MGSPVPTTHLSSLLFSTTTKREHYEQSSQPLLGGSTTAFHSWPQPATQTRARPNKPQQKNVEKQKMPGRPWGKMTTMQGGVKRAATSISFAFRGNQNNHTAVSARRTWRNVFAKSLGPCDTKTPPSMLSCSSPFVYLFIIQWDLQPAFVRQNMFKQCLYVPFIRVYCQI